MRVGAQPKGKHLLLMFQNMIELTQMNYILVQHTEWRKGKPR